MLTQHTEFAQNYNAVIPRSFLLQAHHLTRTCAHQHAWMGSTASNAGDRPHAGRTASEHHQQDTNGQGRKNNHLHKQGITSNGQCRGGNWQNWEEEGETGVGGSRKVWAANITCWSAAIC